MVFYERDKHILPSHQNRPLYVTAYIRDMELRCAVIDLSSLLNIMPLSTLEAIGIPRDRIIDHTSSTVARKNCTSRP